MPRPYGRVVLLLLLFAAVPGARGGEFDDAQVSHIGYPPWFHQGFLDLRQDLGDARAAGKLGLMVLFTTEGCSYCAEFIRRSLGDPGLATLVQDHFDAVGLEIFSDAELVDPRGASLPVKAFAEREGAGFAPTLLFYGRDGRRLYRGVGYLSPQRFRLVLDYLVGGHSDRTSFRDYAAAREAGAATSDSSDRLRPDLLFAAPPFHLDRSRVPAQRSLLVIFEADGCGDCVVLHDEVLVQPEVRDLLQRLDVVRLDAGDASTPVVTPGGSRTTPADWYAETGFSRLPAMLFFEEGGKEVLRTDALVLRQRMMNSLQYTLERAYQKQWTYQRFARSKALERARR
jgi:thioredoxin-related protein